MAIYGVGLWIAGQEARHPAELLRMQNWMIFRGQEGWCTNGAGKCLERLTPSQGVRLLPGPFVVNSRFANAQLQSYFNAIISEHDVPVTAVPPGNAGSFRYDLVVINVEDPYPSGGVQWPYPSSTGGTTQDGPYFNARVIEDVPANTVSVDDIPANHPSGARNWTCIPAAKLKRPQNTATVTQSMIIPLNVVCNPLHGITLPAEALAQYQAKLDVQGSLISSTIGALGQIASGKFSIPGEFKDANACSNSDGTNVLNYSQASYKRWPNEASWPVFVPPWATHADVFVLILGAYQRATAAGVDAHVHGKLRFRIGTSLTGESNYDMDEINSYDNRPPATRPGNRPPMGMTDTMTLQAADIGKLATCQLEGISYQETSTRGQLIADSGCSVYVQINFKEYP